MADKHWVDTHEFTAAEQDQWQHKIGAKSVEFARALIRRYGGASQVAAVLTMHQVEAIESGETPVDWWTPLDKRPSAFAVPPPPPAASADETAKHEAQ